MTACSESRDTHAPKETQVRRWRRVAERPGLERSGALQSTPVTPSALSHDVPARYVARRCSGSDAVPNDTRPE
jgi:hypothetical protein